MTDDLEHNQAGAELAFARAMGWVDWTPEEESEPGMVRGIRVQWASDSEAYLKVYDDGNDDQVYVLVTGQIGRGFDMCGWTTVGEAKRLGHKIEPRYPV